MRKYNCIKSKQKTLGQNCRILEFFLELSMGECAAYIPTLSYQGYYFLDRVVFLKISFQIQQVLVENKLK